MVVGSALAEVLDQALHDETRAPVLSIRLQENGPGACGRWHMMTAHRGGAGAEA
ncbi:hypothetical protein BQ8482_250112 [Mesorhizobium delmotii]|uniref:Uncharacterized protein n=1 Tax=Mesorhizobium delmotii TaxID=1631247 RepID=A0A2P9AM73_9HYPH|nr:hypothetical protein BQ8482_250112 [Mesorhizobium delmotii]